TETCDGRDEDCNGQIDESTAIDAPTWYADTDGDGYGSSSSTVACTAPAGYQANNQDCDDTSSDVSPAGTETCDGRDEDCDGLTDESSAINAPTWYADTDGDGYGGASSTVACTAPSGYLSNNQDCDDTSADVSPAGTESCDGRDEDCDGLTDESSAIDAPTWYADTDGDGYGGASSTVACTRPSGYLANNQDCDDTLADVSPAELESCTNRRDDDCDGQIDGCPLSVTEAVALSGESGSLFSQVESGDLDGDGAVEVGVGGGELLWLLPGDYQQPGTVSGQSPRISGSSLSAFLLGGDRNGDAVAELWWASASESPGGVVWVLDQPSGSGDLGSLAQLRLEGQAGEEFGSALGQIDYDFDGIHELMVGAPGGSGPGLIYAWNLADTGSLSSANADAVLSGAQAGDRAGGGALGAADLDQDGVEDLWVGTPGAGSGAGGLALVRRWEGLPMDLSMADVLWTGNPGEAAGSVVQAADLDLDGYPELLVGTAASSRLYVLPGPLFASGLLEESGARVEGRGGLG
ncbi:MAG TPA: putative metal-binding motif-containing protein, partial [Myxococcota bacterium]|nr:putative metal-binding motif-containing protein [Myxococcota bacterium]